jgi:hypothetical protein
MSDSLSSQSRCGGYLDIVGGSPEASITPEPVRRWRHQLHQTLCSRPDLPSDWPAHFPPKSANTSTGTHPYPIVAVKILNTVSTRQLYRLRAVTDGALWCGACMRRSRLETVASSGDGEIASGTTQAPWCWLDHRLQVHRAFSAAPADPAAALGADGPDSARGGTVMRFVAPPGVFHARRQIRFTGGDFP